MTILGFGQPTASPHSSRGFVTKPTGRQASPSVGMPLCRVPDCRRLQWQRSSIMRATVCYGTKGVICACTYCVWSHCGVLHRMCVLLRTALTPSCRRPHDFWQFCSIRGDWRSAASFEAKHMKELSETSSQRTKESVFSKIDGGHSVRVLLPPFLREGLPKLSWRAQR